MYDFACSQSAMLGLKPYTDPSHLMSNAFLLDVFTKEADEFPRNIKFLKLASNGVINCCPS